VCISNWWMWFAGDNHMGFYIILINKLLQYYSEKTII
jgi:hypothetical protein